MYPIEYVQFLVHFHGDRDYFECHEILEEYWKETDFGNKDSIWVGLILLAVSTYHHRRSNFNGAKRTLEKSLRIFETEAGPLSKLGLDPVRLLTMLKGQSSIIDKKGAYKSFDLPINDKELLEQCMNLCEQKGFEWGKESDLAFINLINRHKLRDRTSVIEDRMRSLKMRKGSE